MEFTNSFTVQAPLSEVWTFMLDAQEVAPCVPGAQITETIDERHYKGTVKVKLGAVQMNYRGEMELDPDEATRRIILRAKGSELRGSGGASGTVTTFLVEGPDGGTEVNIHSQIDVTGRVAQFGRGIMQDVANRLIREFAQCLEQKIVAQSGTAQNAPVQDAESAQPSTAAAEPATSSTATVPPPAPAPTAVSRGNQASGSASSSGLAKELNVANLVVDITRSRLAGLLRAVASRLDPK